MSASSNPLISVVIPALNEEKYITNCLASFAKQTYKDFEIIVSDGGSIDKTISIAKQFGAKTVAKSQTTVTEARQNGMEAASGEIIVGADADTSYPPDHLERIVADFKLDKKIVAVGGGGIFEKKPWWGYWGWKIAYFIIGKMYQLFGTVFYIPAFNLSFNKALFTNAGGYDISLDFGGDELDVLTKLKRSGKVFFDISLSAYPSSRRAKEGFWKLLIKHTLIDYYLGFFLAKLFKRPIIKGKPIR